VSSAASRGSLATAGGDSIRAATNRPPRSPCTSPLPSHSCAASIAGDGLAGPTPPSAAIMTGGAGEGSDAREMRPPVQAAGSSYRRRFIGLLLELLLRLRVASPAREGAADLEIPWPMLEGGERSSEPARGGRRALSAHLHEPAREGGAGA
jgi:hypothetical protein